MNDLKSSEKEIWQSVLLHGWEKKLIIIIMLPIFVHNNDKIQENLHIYIYIDWLIYRYKIYLHDVRKLTVQLARFGHETAF